MKSYSCFVLILVGVCCFLCCEKPSNPSPPDLSGIYQGEAEVSILETRSDLNGDITELVILDTLIMDHITVSAVSLEDYIFHIERSSDFFSSFYDFEGEKSISQDYQWNVGYEYDKKWETYIHFNPAQDSLSAYMLVSDIFESFQEDSQGNLLYYYVRKKEYKIKAVR